MADTDQNLYEPPEKLCPGQVRRRFIDNGFTQAHFWVFLLIWGGFTFLTYRIVSVGVDDNEPRRSRLVFLTTAATITGPMTGAISRDLQSCCLEFSLSLLPYCGAILSVGVLAQIINWPSNWPARAIRMLVWILAWLGWFMGGMVSFAHALS
jgi:hypothetical protein